VRSAKIDVRAFANDEFQVHLTNGKIQSSHRVTMKEADYQRLTAGKISAEDLVRRSFEFLLAREAQESILEQFDLSLISHYFPEYEEEIQSKR
jgi:hypothetical protein